MQGSVKKISVLILAGLGMVCGLHSQSVPNQPYSIPVYHPMMLNPAYVGSKDFTNISLTTRIVKFTNQVVNVHKRIPSKEEQYSNFGLGAFAFNEQKDQSWNSGIGISAAYHLPLDKEHLHNLSGGITAKGIFSGPKKDEFPGFDSAEITFTPDIDLGLYYYSPSAFAGISVTSLLESSDDKDSITLSYSTIRRAYKLHAGYKFIIQREMGVILEPSILVSVGDETINEPHKHITPYLKVYLQNFYVGSYFKDLDTFALFFQYQFPKFYTGLFLEFPRIGYLNNDNIIFELSLGLNLGRSGEKFLQYRHW